MIDKLGIFAEIKATILEIEPQAILIAHGSRITEKVHEHGNKWDFDILLQNVDLKHYGKIKNYLCNHFGERVDEFGTKIRIDLSIDINNRFKNGSRL